MIPCIHMYCVILFVNPYTFESLPWQLLKAKHMRINVGGDLDDSSDHSDDSNPNQIDPYDIELDFDLDLECDVQIEDLIPIQTTDRRENKKTQMEMIAISDRIRNLSYEG